MTSTDAPAAALRVQVASWLAAHWKPTLDPMAWRATVVDSGWAFPTWPSDCHGRSVAAELVHVVEEEFERVGAPSPGFGPGLNTHTFFLANTIREHGSEAMRRTILPSLLRGELGEGCLLYSEPGAGSDLASLQTRADRRGDGYVVNGQKIWSSMALFADWGVLIARTNWDLPKHRGLSLFVLPMATGGVREPGVEVRTIRQITGETNFCEVFLDDAWVPEANRIGDENDGWRLLQTALASERAAMGDLYRARAVEVSVSPCLDAAQDLADAARASGRERDPVVRQSLARILTWRLVRDWTAQRSAEERLAKGSSPLASLSKLANSGILHQTGAFLCMLEGARATLYDYEEFDADTAGSRLMKAFVNSIGGGSDQIQRNIIGERILGLPRELEPGRDLPFREAPKALQQTS